MKVRISSVAILTLALSWAALAQSSSPMREGMWEVNSKLNIPGMEGLPPMKQQQCITPAMIKDPQLAIPKIDNDCKISDYKLEASTATYTLTCTQPAAVTATGEIKYSGTDAYTGTLKIEGAGQVFTVTYDAKRTGDCAK